MLAAAEATPEVLDDNDSPLAELYTYPHGSGEAEEDSSANDTVVNSAGMQSMTSNVTAGDADAICRNNAFLLPLQLGQNSFSVAIAAPDLPEQASVQLCHPGPCTTCMQQDCPCVEFCTGHGILASSQALSTLCCTVLVCCTSLCLCFVLHCASVLHCTVLVCFTALCLCASLHCPSVLHCTALVCCTVGQ